jgi:CheY-like chemotaxis protein
MAAEKNISVSCAIDDNVKGIMGDERRLKQVLVNLLTNAVKFTPKGGAVSLCVTGNAEDNIVHFAVSDTGIGIYEDDILELFKPFVQLEGSFSRNYAGTGLGLSLVSKLVELHNGSVRVESEPNKGSTFTISIPWCSERKTVSEDLFKDEVIKPKLLIKKKPTPTILLVEDNEDNIVTMQEFLKFQGFDVVVARNGKECLEHIKKSVPDLIVMDIQMPVMDGLEATKIVRQHHKAAELPIIALTALAMPGDKERCLAAGANKYFSKPVSLNQLLVLIKELIPVD